jgi:O-antigen/teichoic acid export membrane protein
MNDIKRSTAWHLFGRVIQRSINPLFMIMVASSLASEDFAIFTFVLASSNAIASIVQSPIENLGRVGLAQKNNWGVKVWVIIFLAMIAVFFLAGSIVSNLTLGLEKQDHSLWYNLLLLSFALSLWAGMMSFLNGFRMYKSQAYLSMMLFLFVFGFSWVIYFKYIDFSFINVLILSYFMTLLLFCYQVSNIKVTVKEKAEIDWKFIYSIVLPAFLSSTVIGIVLIRVQSLFYSIGLDELSVYNVLNQLKGLVVFIPVALQSIVIPHIYAYYKNSDASLINKKNLKISSAVVLVSALLLLFADYLIVDLYALSTSEMSQQINLFVLLVFLTGISAPIGSMLIIKYGLWANMLLNMLFALTFILGSYLFVPVDSQDILIMLNVSYFVLFVVGVFLVRDQMHPI